MKNKHICLIADGRSPTTVRWIQMLEKLGFKISLISTYPMNDELNVDQTFILPIAFSNAGKSQNTSVNANLQKKLPFKKLLIQQFRPVVLQVRYHLGPSTISKFERIYKNIIADIKPDIVHALRIPYEGMLGKYTPKEIPFLVSIWGNDFTLHANANKKMAFQTREVMTRADGVLADTIRDINLSYFWGLNQEKPTLVVPGGGGISFEEIKDAKNENFFASSDEHKGPVIVNPRGIRSYAQTDVFFQALPMVLTRYPGAKVFCPTMEGKIEAIKWVNQLNLQKSVTLLPSLSQKMLWSLFHQSDISISLTSHDGTPNTLLEAMACGCLPIAGDIESLREWITPGVNGLLVELNKPQALADGIICVIQNSEFKQKAALINRIRIKEKAEINQVHQRILDFYLRFL
jgi:glycosyltransferase involved in cell wall biosynthesis